MIDEFFMRDSYIPLNEKGEEMTFEELDAYLKSLPKLESPQNLEEKSTLIDEPLEEWARRNGLESLQDFMARRGIDIAELQMEFLLENEYGKHYIDEDGKISIILNEDAKGYLTLKEASDYCIEIISAFQMKKFGRLL